MLFEKKKKKKKKKTNKKKTQGKINLKKKDCQKTGEAYTPTSASKRAKAPPRRREANITLAIHGKSVDKKR